MWCDSASANETRCLGERIGRCLEPNTVITLRGPLGAGKTTLAQGIAAGLDVEEPVSSPTFNLVQEYGGRLTLWHVDAYRIRSLDEIIDLSLPELLTAGGVVIIEWPEAVERVLPTDRLDIAIEPVEGDRRRIELVAGGPGAQMLLECLERELAPRG